MYPALYKIMKRHSPLQLLSQIRRMRIYIYIKKSYLNPYSVSTLARENERFRGGEKETERRMEKGRVLPITRRIYHRGVGVVEESAPPQSS